MEERQDQDIDTRTKRLVIIITYFDFKCPKVVVDRAA